MCTAASKIIHETWKQDELHMKTNHEQVQTLVVTEILVQFYKPHQNFFYETVFDG